MTEASQPLRFGIGLDLGRENDFTAIAISQIGLRGTGETIPTGARELVAAANGRPLAERALTRERMETTYGVRHLERMRGISYVAQVARLGALIRALPAEPTPFLAVDHTGVGVAVLDIIVAAGLGVPIVAVQIATSAMAEAKRDERRPWKWVVPKRDLIAVMTVLLESDRWQCSARLPDAKVLREEMAKFRRRVTVHATETFAAAREGDHDDLVLAAAIACWAGERAVGRGGVI